MPKVLTEDALIQCQHGGRVQVIASQRVLMAGGRPVLVQGDLDGKPISGCPVVDSSPPAPLMKRCLMVVSMTAGGASKLAAGGKPVLLDTAIGFTDGITTPGPTNTWRVVGAGQNTLEAI
jgi:hypothetical protein